MTKKLKNSHLLLIFLKNWKQKTKILLPKLFGQYCCAYSSQILERTDENWGSLYDLKKSLMDGWTDRQMDDGRSASDKLCWLCQQWSLKHILVTDIMCFVMKFMLSVECNRTLVIIIHHGLKSNLLKIYRESFADATNEFCLTFKVTLELYIWVKW